MDKMEAAKRVSIVPYPFRCLSAKFLLSLKELEHHQCIYEHEISSELTARIPVPRNCLYKVQQLHELTPTR